MARFDQLFDTALRDEIDMTEEVAAAARKPSGRERVGLTDSESPAIRREPSEGSSRGLDIDKAEAVASDEASAPIRALAQAAAEAAAEKAARKEARKAAREEEEQERQDALDAFLQAQDDAMQAALDLLEEDDDDKKTPGEWLKGAVEDAGDWVEEAAEDVVEVVEDVVEVIVEAVEDVVETIGEVVDAGLQALEDSGFFEVLEVITLGALDVEYDEDGLHVDIGVLGLVSVGVDVGAGGFNVEAEVDLGPLGGASANFGVDEDGDMSAGASAEIHVPTPWGSLDAEGSVSIEQEAEGWSAELDATVGTTTLAGQHVGVGVHVRTESDGEGNSETTIGTHQVVGQRGVGEVRTEENLIINSDDGEVTTEGEATIKGEGAFEGLDETVNLWDDDKEKDKDKNDDNGEDGTIHVDIYGRPVDQSGGGGDNKNGDNKNGDNTSSIDDLTQPSRQRAPRLASEVARAEAVSPEVAAVVNVDPVDAGSVAVPPGDGLETADDVPKRQRASKADADDASDDIADSMAGMEPVEAHADLAANSGIELDITTDIEAMEGSR